MIDDLFSADTDAAARDRIAKPLPPKPAETKFSAWRTITAPVRGVVEAAAQGLASTAEVIGGYGQVLGAYPEAVGYSPTGEARKQADAARSKLLTGGVDLNNDVGDALREAGRSYRPDPTTAHAAEQLVYGFARGASKVVGGAVTMGPAGVLMAGAEEGLSAADDLRAQGVSFGARSAAGAVQGAGLALAALPAVGQTLKATAGLYALGGPVGFVAQQAATREILQGAGYEQIGAQFDPFDPVGLAVATLLPAGFAWHGMRQQKIARAVASLPDLPPRADAAPVAEAVPPAQFPGRPSAVADAVRAYPTEAVDAARVVLLAERRAVANPGAPDNLRAMDQHEAALARAEEQINAGERVAVEDVAPSIAPRGAAVRIIESTDAGPGGQINGTLRVDIGGADGGRLDYTVYDGIPQISMIEVPEGMRRMGIGGELVRELQRRFPDTEIQWGMTTEDGAALRAALPSITEDIASVKAQQRELAGAIAQRDQMLKIAAEFQAIDQPTQAQRDSFAARVEPLNDLHDEIARLQSQLDGVRDTKTLIAIDSPYATWADQITAAIRELQSTRTDAPTAPQAPNPEAAAPARGAGDAAAAAESADPGRAAAGVEAARLTAQAREALQADLIAQRKRVSILNSLLECISA